MIRRADTVGIAGLLCDAVDGVVGELAARGSYWDASGAIELMIEAVERRITPAAVKGRVEIREEPRPSRMTGAALRRR
ncbi:hypothetical protein ACFWHR_11075 [Leucobacter sp. NPDC058333]|uniref:hypothetical protein n=1 Tax=Leucobacter sp. NPDC058333 TaxID=3346450 RepID=UPI00364F87B8